MSPVIRTSGGPKPDGAQPLPLGEEKRAAVRSMFDAIAPRYDLVNAIMTFGLDSSWRRRTLDLLEVPAGSLVLDIGCGTGDLARSLRRGGRRALGVDLSFGMLAAARAGGAPLLQADAAALPLADGAADGAVSGFALRNLSDLDAALRELCRVLRPGSRLALLEVGEPEGAVLRLGHRLWFNRVVPLLGALFSDAAAYRYLPRSVAYLPTLEDLTARLERAGFSDVRRVGLNGGIAQCFTATRCEKTGGTKT